MWRHHPTIILIPIRICLLCLGLSLMACSNDEGIYISVTNLADKTTPALTNVVVIAGDEKYSRSTLEGGESQSVTLHADPRSERELTLSFTQGDQRKYWGGAKFGMGNQGYRIDLQVDATGAVTGRYCVKPCSLDEASIPLCGSGGDIPP